MLQAIRGRAASWVVKVLFGLLIISFGAWGVADYVRSAAVPTVVAEVGPVKIDPQTFSNAVSMEIQRFRQILGANFDREQAKAFGLGERVLDQIVQKTLLELEAKRLGITISDEVVREAIRNNPAFKNEAGQFDRNRFEAVVYRAGFSEDRFIAEMRRDLQRAQLVRPISEGAGAPQAMIDAILKYRGERRVAETIAVGHAVAGEVAAPTEAQLEEYVKANSQRFMKPEYRAISWFTLSADDLAGRMTITDTEAKDAYTARIDDYTTPERRTVEQLLLPDEASANEASQKLAGGASFADTAQALGKPGADSDLGAVTASELPEELSKPIFALAVGMPSKPVKSGFGWHVFRVTAVTPSSVESFEAVRDKLVADLKREKAGDEVPALANKIEDALAGGAALQEAAARGDLPIRNVPALDQRGRGPDGAPVADLPAGPLLSTAFGLAEGQTSRLVETTPDHYLAVKVDKVTPAVLPPLAEIREAVAAAWTSAQKDAAAKARAEALLEQLKGGADIAKAAADAGLEAKTTEPFTREGGGGQLAAGLANPLFGGPVGTAAMAAAPGGDGYVVARLKEILPVDPATSEAQATRLKTELKQAIANDMLQQFETSLRRRFSVTVHQRAVELAM